MKKISIITSKKYLKSKNYESLIEILKSNGIEYEILYVDENIDLKITNSNLILSVGGDGTALRAMKIAWLSNLPCLLYTSPSPRDKTVSRMPSSA